VGAEACTDSSQDGEYRYVSAQCLVELDCLE
jgi:hypothetical protein